MKPTLIGYARCSSNAQKLYSQIATLEALGVASSNIYPDQGKKGFTRDRPGLRSALAACKQGDTLMVTAVDRLSRRTVDALNIAQELWDRGVSIGVGGMVFNFDDGREYGMFGVQAVFAQMDYSSIKERTMTGIKRAQEQGKFKGRPPALSTDMERELVATYRRGDVTQDEVAVAFGVSRNTVARVLKRNPKPVVRALVS